MKEINYKDLKNEFQVTIRQDKWKIIAIYVLALVTMSFFYRYQMPLKQSSYIIKLNKELSATEVFLHIESAFKNIEAKSIMLKFSAKNNENLIIDYFLTKDQNENIVTLTINSDSRFTCNEIDQYVRAKIESEKLIHSLNTDYYNNLDSVRNYLAKGIDYLKSIEVSHEEDKIRKQELEVTLRGRLIKLNTDNLTNLPVNVGVAICNDEDTLKINFPLSSYLRYSIISLVLIFGLFFYKNVIKIILPPQTR